jgi:HD domain
MGAKFGMLEWGRKNNGMLTPTERLHFLRNIAFLAAREASDVIRDKLGLLRPVELTFSDFVPPDSRMAKDAEVFAGQTHTQDLLSHGYRTYYFGAIIASYSKLKYDKELYFTAALLHDIGLTESRIVPLEACCFAVAGGRQIHDLLISKGHSAEKAQIVGDAISAHLNLYLPVREYGEVAALVARGAVCDLFGFGKRRVNERFKKDLLQAYPAGNIQDALLSKEEMAPGSRLDIGRSLRGGLPERIWIQDIS